MRKNSSFILGALAGTCLTLLAAGPKSEFWVQAAKAATSGAKAAPMSEKMVSSRRAQPLAMERVQALTRLPGAPGRRELADYYTALTGRSTEALSFYMVLAFFKLAAIVEGAHLHHTTGALQTDYSRGLEQDVPRLLAEAAWFAGLG